MTRSKRKPGPRNALVDEFPHVTAIKAELARRGFTSLSDAARREKLSVGWLTRTIREGLAADPKASTLERLGRLGILDLVKGIRDTG